MARSTSQDGHQCFELDGALVHGDPNMSQESKDALSEVIAAARERLRVTACGGCGHSWGAHGAAGCTARRGWPTDRCQCREVDLSGGDASIDSDTAQPSSGPAAAETAPNRHSGVRD